MRVIGGGKHMTPTLPRRVFLIALGGLRGTAFLGACTAAPSAPGGQQAPAAGGQAVTLRVQERANNIVEGGPQYELYRTHVETWKAAHPNVDLKVESMPTGSEYVTKMLSLHMGGGLGDVVYAAIGSGSFQAFASAGALAPLDDFER